MTQGELYLSHGTLVGNRIQRCRRPQCPQPAPLFLALSRRQRLAARTCHVSGGWIVVDSARGYLGESRNHNALRHAQARVESIASVHRAILQRYKTENDK